MKWLSGWAFPESALDPLRAKLGGPCAPRAGAVARSATATQFPIIGSWSLGSFQSLETAIQNPRSMPALVLISSTARFCATADYACGLPEGNLRAMQRGLARDARGTLDSFHKLCAAPEILSDAEIAARTDAGLSLGLETLAAGLRDLREKDFRGRVGEVACPVLLLHGEEDRVIPCGASRWLAEHLPDATLVTLPGAGHDLPIRHADWVAEQIADFMGKVL